MASTLVVPIIQVQNVRPHSGADKLDICDVLGFQMCVPRGVYKNGDTAIYIPADSLVPSEWAEKWGVSAYLKGPEKNRVSQVRLRGEPSFGLIVDMKWLSSPANVGDNVAEMFGIQKYEPPVKIGTADQAPYDSAIDPLFQKYTDIENGRIFTEVFKDREMVVATEKIHGCLEGRMRVSMADGTLKRIKDISVGEYVLGTNENGVVVSTKVTNVFNNGRSGNWLRIQGKRTNSGRGNHYWRVVCTTNHRFYSPEKKKYVQADALRVGDKVLSVRNAPSLNNIQSQIILGMLLGDASYRKTPSLGGMVSWSHKTAHADYMKWIDLGLGDMSTEYRYSMVSGYCTRMESSNSVSNPFIRDFVERIFTFRRFGGRNIKGLKPAIVDELGPIALAFWYMDDGSLSTVPGQEDRAHFAVCGFRKKDCELLQKGLLKYGISSVLYKADGYYRIRLNADEADKFFLIVSPYIPECMQYKLPERYRGGKGWLPKIGSSYKSILVEQTITNIDSLPNNRTIRRDIETDTHNFFVSGILVHNSNNRVGFVGDAVVAGSRTCRKSRPKDDDLFRYRDWFPLTIPEVHCLLQHLKIQGANSAILYGEVFGRSVQSLGYGFEKGKLGYRAFDLLIDGKYVDHAEFQRLCKEFGVATAPLLYDGPFSMAMIKEVAEGKTTIPGADHIREGVVVKPVAERTDPKIGRAILKYISMEYSLSKHKEQDTTDV